jgi:hypothetical protein
MVYIVATGLERVNEFRRASKKGLKSVKAPWKPYKPLTLTFNHSAFDKGAYSSGVCMIIRINRVFISLKQH